MRYLFCFSKTMALRNAEYQKVVTAGQEERVSAIRRERTKPGAAKPTCDVCRIVRSSTQKIPLRQITDSATTRAIQRIIHDRLETKFHNAEECPLLKFADILAEHYPAAFGGDSQSTGSSRGRGGERGRGGDGNKGGRAIVARGGTLMLRGGAQASRAEKRSFVAPAPPRYGDDGNEITKPEEKLLFSDICREEDAAELASYLMFSPGCLYSSNLPQVGDYRVGRFVTPTSFKDPSVDEGVDLSLIPEGRFVRLTGVGRCSTNTNPSEFEWWPCTFDWGNLHVDVGEGVTAEAVAAGTGKSLPEAAYLAGLALVILGTEVTLTITADGAEVEYEDRDNLIGNYENLMKIADYRYFHSRELLTKRRYISVAPFIQFLLVGTAFPNALCYVNLVPTLMRWGMSLNFEETKETGTYVGKQVFFSVAANHYAPIDAIDRVSFSFGASMKDNVHIRRTGKEGKDQHLTHTTRAISIRPPPTDLDLQRKAPMVTEDASDELTQLRRELEESRESNAKLQKQLEPEALEPIMARMFEAMMAKRAGSDAAAVMTTPPVPEAGKAAGEDDKTFERIFD